MHSILHSIYFKLLTLLVAMDPNDSYANISPLHEALRGTTAMPTLNDFVPLESPSSDSPLVGNSLQTIHAPREATLFSENDSTMIPYQSNTYLAPLPPQLSDTIPNPSSLEENEMFSHDFLTNPFWNEFDSSHQKQKFSMEVSSFTSLLRKEPNSIAHSLLNTVGESDDGSISKMATRLVSKQEQNIQDGRLLHGAPYGLPAPGSLVMQSSHAPREDKIPLVGPNGNSTSANMHGSTISRKYTCKICSATFNTSQAYGGHMSSHSKARMKSLQS
uniref:C2H2-type domain-containing protein n=1 Tax=Hordeum vulgare subsp. vulgare TaxID=112509 RepID=A0A8I6WQL8_HORVV